MDGTTATTLAPSEEEMNHAVGYIQRMKDAIVEGSRLAQSFAELRGEFDKMRGELESLRSTNRWMDTQITELREQRDRAIETSNKQATELVNLKHDYTNSQLHCDNQRETLARLNEQVAQLRKERDDALFKVEELNEVGQTLQDKLDTIVGLVCPKEVVIGDSRPTSFVEQPRDPETQQFRAYPEVATEPKPWVREDF